MAKRFTDTDKWEDEWFTELSNDYKVIWFYLLDTCDNAGIWKKNIKKLNYLCNTDVNADDLLKVFKNRLSVITDEKWFINKFCIVQYGHDFLNSKNKAVVSAIDKLIVVGIIDNQYSTNTLSIPYQYSIDTPKEQEQDKVKVQEQDKVIDKVEVKEEVKDNEKSIIEKALLSLMQTEDIPLFNKGVDIINEYGGYINAIQLIGIDDDIKQNWIRKIQNTNAILEMNYS